MPRSSVAARCITVGTLCAVLSLLGQFTLVHFSYNGNWTGLFLTGDRRPAPPQLAHENILVFENSRGYDGQFYHYMAHDPFRRTDLSEWVDVPHLRYQRLLVPLAAWLLALGSDEYVDRAYYIVILLFVFLGGYWSARFCEVHGRHPLYGLAFLLVPSVLVSIERLTVEIALAALTAGFAFYATRGPSWKLYLVLAAAVLTRETGLFLVGGYALSCLGQKRFLRAVASAASAVPGVAWILAVSRGQHAIAVDVVRSIDTRPHYLGLLRRLIDPINYRRLRGVKVVVAWITDEIAWIGMVLLGVLGIRIALRKQPGPIEMTAALCGFVALFVVGGKGFWIHPVGYSRPFTPLLVLMGLLAIIDRRIWFAVPILMIDFRLAVEWAPRLLDIFDPATAPSLQ